MTTTNTNTPPEGFPKTHPVYGKYEYAKDGIVIYSKDGVKHGIKEDTKEYKFLKDGNGVMHYYSNTDGVLHTKDDKIKLPPPTSFEFDPTNFVSPEAERFTEFINNPDNKEVIDAAYNTYMTEFGAEKFLNKSQFKKSLIEGNKYNYTSKAAYRNPATKRHPSWDVLIDGKKNVFANDYAKYVGAEDFFNEDFTKDYQGTYYSLAKTSIDPNYVGVFEQNNLSLLPEGVTDQKAIDDLNKGISPREGYFGNTTNDQKGTWTSSAIPPETEETTIPPEDRVDLGEKLKTEEEDTYEEEDDFEKEQPNLDTWFAPDITNFVGSLTDKVNRYEPTQAKLDLVKPGYDLLDPTRQLAANQEQMARYQQQVENTLDPQMALAVSLGASGEGFQNAANVLANVENANVGIVNQAYQQNAAIENQEIAGNESGRQQYVANMATLNENYDKAKNLKKWRSISAFNQGWHNYNKDQMMENVLFPQVHTNNITGDVRFSGNGRDIDGPNTYNPYGTGPAQISPEYWGSVYSQANKQFESVEPDADKRAKMVDGYMNNYMKMNQKGTQGFDPRMYAQMAGIQ